MKTISRPKGVLIQHGSGESRPQLEAGEAIILEGRAARITGFFGGAGGPLILTDRRLVWHETRASVWPLRPMSKQWRLSDIVSVDKGTLLHFVFGGRRLRFRFRNGSSECLFEGQGRLDEWISAIGALIGNDDKSPSESGAEPME